MVLWDLADQTSTLTDGTIRSSQWSYTSGPLKRRTLVRPSGHGGGAWFRLSAV